MAQGGEVEEGRAFCARGDSGDLRKMEKENEVSLLEIPEHAFLKIQVAAGDPTSVCALEMLARSAPKSGELAWSAVLEEFFPSLFLKLEAQDPFL